MAYNKQIFYNDNLGAFSKVAHNFEWFHVYLLAAHQALHWTPLVEDLSGTARYKTIRSPSAVMVGGWTLLQYL